MARIRSIHPEQFTDEDFVALSPRAQVLCIAIRNFADDNGVIPWKPQELHSRIFPRADVDMEALLQELVDHRHVCVYTCGGRTFGIIRNFHRFQSPRHPSFKWPVVANLPPGFEPSPKCAASRCAGELVTVCGRSTVALPEDYGSPPAGSERIGEEGNGRGEEGGDTSSPLPADAGNPLSEWPELDEAYPELCALQAAAHPHVKPPAPGSKADRAQRATLAKLVRLDGIAAGEVVACLRWVFTDDHRDARFWRQNVLAFGSSLRKRKDGGPPKFVRLHAQWKAIEAKTRTVTATVDPELLRVTRRREGAQS